MVENTPESNTQHNKDIYGKIIFNNIIINVFGVRYLKISIANIVVPFYKCASNDQPILTALCTVWVISL